MIDGSTVRGAIVIDCDHAVYRMKRMLILNLRQIGCAVEDKGTNGEDSVDACPYAIAVAEEVAADPQKRGVLVCGSGIGMSIMSNKVKGIRASLVSDLFSAQAAREHNEANLLCLGARVVAENMDWELTKVWLSAKPLGGKYAERIGRVAAYLNKEQASDGGNAMMKKQTAIPSRCRRRSPAWTWGICAIRSKRWKPPPRRFSL